MRTLNFNRFNTNFVLQEARASTAAPAPDHVPDSDNEVSEEDSSEEVERIRSPPAPKRRKRSTRRYR